MGKVKPSVQRLGDLHIANSASQSRKKTVNQNLGSRRLVLLFDSGTQPWRGDLQGIIGELLRLQNRNMKVELKDVKKMSEQELDEWRNQAMAASVWHAQGIRRPFGSVTQGMLPYFGRQVPALLVFEEGQEIPAAVYPHRKKRGRVTEDFPIEGFLGQLAPSDGKA